MMNTIHGVINICKPTGMTSFDVVKLLRRILKVKKIGHTGTLDPEAEGVLVVCIGKATKAIEFMMNDNKVYRAELTLGIETDTEDIWGRVLKKHENINLQEQEIIDAILSFIGEYQQIPPMYSALKVNGEKLYNLARSGITIDRQPRGVEIYSIDIIQIVDNEKVIFDVCCSKGTYIRTLCADIGRKLNCGGVMSALKRVKCGVFDVSNSLNINELINEQNIDKAVKVISDKIIKLDIIFANMDLIILDKVDEKRFINGVQVQVNQGDSSLDSRVYNEEGNFLGIGNKIMVGSKFYIKSKKLFI